MIYFIAYSLSANNEYNFSCGTANDFSAIIPLKEMDYLFMVGDNILTIYNTGGRLACVRANNELVDNMAKEIIDLVKNGTLHNLNASGVKEVLDSIYPIKDNK